MARRRTAGGNPAAGARPEPRYGRFLGTGAALGLAVAAVLAATRSGGPDYGFGQVLLYLGVLLGIVGVLIAGGVAVLLDRRAEGRARRRR